MRYKQAKILNSKGEKIESEYDVAQTNRHNENHWQSADSLSADAANSLDVRKKIRERSRYEVANNSYARGIVDTLSHDCVGRGPRLQISGANGLEEKWQNWSKEVHLSQKLRTMRKNRCVDGESFAILVTEDSLDSEVKLYPRLIECDRVTDGINSEIEGIDGIELNDNGIPKRYRVLKKHPGDGAGMTLEDEARPIDASDVLHLFPKNRAEQHRGVSELTPALPLFALLRRYTLATLDAAETASDISAVLQTDTPPGQDALDIDALDVIEIEKDSIMTLPYGWEIGQMRPEQPITGYAEFKQEIIQEIARCLNVPYNIASGNSSDYNYASGRLDHLNYWRATEIIQEEMEIKILDRLLKSFLREMGVLGEEVPLPSHTWYWEGRQHADPTKVADARETDLENNATTLKEEYAKKGQDWEEQIEQRAREKEKLEELGLTKEEALPPRRNNSQEEEENGDQ